MKRITLLIKKIENHFIRAFNGKIKHDYMIMMLKFDPQRWVVGGFSRRKS